MCGVLYKSINSCYMCFQRNISLLLGRMEARRCVVFAGGSGPAALVGGGSAAVAACRGREASAARAAGRPWPYDLERVATPYAYQDRQPSAVTRRRPHAMPGNTTRKQTFNPLRF